MHFKIQLQLKATSGTSKLNTECSAAEVHANGTPAPLKRNKKLTLKHHKTKNNQSMPVNMTATKQHKTTTRQEDATSWLHTLKL